MIRRISNMIKENRIGTPHIIYIDFPLIEQENGAYHLSEPQIVLGKCEYRIPTQEQRSIKWRWRERYVSGSEYGYIIKTPNGLKVITSSDGMMENIIGGFIQLQTIFNPWKNRFYCDDRAYESLQGIGLPEEEIKKLKNLESKLLRKK